MTPSETPRYEADNPLYRPRMPSFRRMSMVIVIAGPSGDDLGARAAVPAAAETDEDADCDKAAAEEAIGFGNGEAAGAALAAGEATLRFFAESCNLVLITICKHRTIQRSLCTYPR